MLIAIFPLMVLLVGLLMWLLSMNAKVIDIGRIMFIVGLFWTVYALVGKTVHIG